MEYRCTTAQTDRLDECVGPERSACPPTRPASHPDVDSRLGQRREYPIPQCSIELRPQTLSEAVNIQVSFSSAKRAIQIGVFQTHALVPRSRQARTAQFLDPTLSTAFPTTRPPHPNLHTVRATQIINNNPLTAVESSPLTEGSLEPERLSS